MTWLFSNLLTMLIIGGVLLAVMFVINPLTGKAIVATVSGSTGAFGRWLRNKFPQWIMQYELDKASREINRYWDQITETQEHTRSLSRKRDEKIREIARLTKLSQQAASLSTLEGDADARSFIKNKQRIQKELDEISEVINNKQQEIQSAQANIAAYEEQVSSMKAEAESKSLSLKTKRVDAALSKKLSNLNDLNNNGLAQAKEALDKAVDRAEAEIQTNKVRYQKINTERKYTQSSIDEETEQELAKLKNDIANKNNSAS